MSSDTALDPDFLDEDDEDWEDGKTYKEIIDSMPDGWALVRVMASWNQMEEMRQWLVDEATGQYREVGWDSGYCSYSTGVMLEKEMDAVLFKLRWG